MPQNGQKEEITYGLVQWRLWKKKSFAHSRQAAGCNALLLFFFKKVQISSVGIVWSTDYNIYSILKRFVKFEYMTVQEAALNGEYRYYAVEIE